MLFHCFHHFEIPKLQSLHVWAQAATGHQGGLAAAPEELRRAALGEGWALAAQPEQAGGQAVLGWFGDDIGIAWYSW